jgi:hypothetical protein
MSYSIDFHYTVLKISVEQILSRVHQILYRDHFAFLAYCHELYLDEEGEIDTKFPALKIRTIEEAAMRSSDWIGRSHHYRWQTEFDLAVYSWCQSSNTYALVLSIDYKEWKSSLNLSQKIGGILCAISNAIDSSFGYSKINSKFLPLEASAFYEALELIKTGNSEPQVFWVSEAQLSYKELQAIAKDRTIIQSTLGYVLALKHSI